MSFRICSYTSTAINVYLKNRSVTYTVLTRIDSISLSVDAFVTQHYNPSRRSGEILQPCR